MAPNGYKLFQPAEPGTYTWTVYDRKRQSWTTPERVDVIRGQRGFRIKRGESQVIDLSDFHKTGYMAWKRVD